MYLEKRSFREVHLTSALGIHVVVSLLSSIICIKSRVVQGIAFPKASLDVVECSVADILRVARIHKYKLTLSIVHYGHVLGP